MNDISNIYRTVSFDESLCEIDENGRCSFINPKPFLHGDKLIVPDKVIMPDGNINEDVWFKRDVLQVFFADTKFPVSMYAGKSLMSIFNDLENDFLGIEDLHRLINFGCLSNINFYETYSSENEADSLFKNKHGIIYRDDVIFFVPWSNEYVYKLDLNSVEILKYNEIHGNDTGINDCFGGIYSKDGKVFLKWSNHCSNFDSYRFRPGIEEIGDSIFDDCLATGTYFGFSVKRLVIPESVKKIGKSAFERVYFDELQLPQNLESLGDSAFFGCQGLKKIFLPTNLKIIGDHVFAGSSVREVYLNKNLQYIGKDPFFNCLKLAYIGVDRGNDNFCSIDGALFNKDCTKLIHIPYAKLKTEEDKFPDNSQVTGLPNIEPEYSYRFEFCIPETVKEIDSNAFSRTCLKEIIIPDSATFCGESGSIDEECIQHIHIGAKAKLSSSTLTKCQVNNLTLSADNPYYKVVDGVLYSKDLTELIKCTVAKTSIDIPLSVEIICSGAFCGTQIREITIPSSVTLIGESVFMNSSLKKIKLPSSICSFYEDSFTTNAELVIEAPKDLIDKARDAGCRLDYTSYCECYNKIIESETIIDESNINLLPDIRLCPKDDNFLYIPAGSWSYYSELNTIDSEDYLELFEVSRSMQIKHLEDLQSFFCNIYSSTDRIVYSGLSQMKGISRNLETYENVSIKADDGSLLRIFFRNDSIETNIGNAGFILSFLGFDQEQYLRDSLDVVEYKKGEESFENCIGETLAAPLFKRWKEDVVDEETGEVVSVTHSALIAFSGEEITQELYDSISKNRDIDHFFVQSGSYERDLYSMGVYPYCSMIESEIYLYNKIATQSNNPIFNDDYNCESAKKVLRYLCPNKQDASWTKGLIKDLQEDYLSIISYLMNYAINLPRFKVLENSCLSGNKCDHIAEEISQFFDLKIKELKQCHSELDAFKLFHTDEEWIQLLREYLSDKGFDILI